jgi:hypothetical protein
MLSSALDQEAKASLALPLGGLAFGLSSTSDEAEQIASNWFAFS